MFTDRAKKLIDLAKGCAFSRTEKILDVEAVLAAVGSHPEAAVRLAECLCGGNVARIRENCPDMGAPVPCPTRLEMTEALRAIIEFAAELASGKGVPDHEHPGLIDIRHLVCSLAASDEACRRLGGCLPVSREEAVAILSRWYGDGVDAATIGGLIGTLRALRQELQGKLFGQDHAVHSFLEGLYNSEMAAAADAERKRPAAVFLFAGPAGVGKTYMAELCASFLKRPFKRFDMTGYSDHQDHHQLVGFASSYKGAHPGQLTGFVDKNPDAILLFDEIEKAHLATVQLFYQILDAGHLEDKYTEKDISFRDSVIIFTTNAGRTLYDNPNRSGISAANSTYHRRTILSALEIETNPATGQPAFPQPLCSRLAQGYPLMFNRLGINELVKVCETELTRNERLLEQQYFKRFDHDELVPLALVLKEGIRADARQLRSESEKFIKNELFRYASLYTEDRLEDALDSIDAVHFEAAAGLSRLDPETAAIFEMPDKPRVLLVANSEFAVLCRDLVGEIRWSHCGSSEEVVEILAGTEIDMVLLDIWVQRKFSGRADDSRSGRLSDTVDPELDFVPFSARALDTGREVLRLIHERFPRTPVFLLSFTDPIPEEPSVTLFGQTLHRPVDDELFLACVRAGGARGVLECGFINSFGLNWEARRNQFAADLLAVNRRLYREKRGRSLARRRKVLRFETAAKRDRENRSLRIQLRNFTLARTVDAVDAGEMVSDVERPTTRFEDVLGAEDAKDALRYVVDWIKNPRRYAALGIRPPRGVLLTGAPGTGKTMLARAVAGESECAFLEKSASSFVTVWQGSGPQNVRRLFDRARRYAPAIVFLDEFDSIGLRRSGGMGAARAQEETLNAILTEMDGFGAPSQQPLIVLAATNFAENLDEAVKRRFDRLIEVERPDMAARRQYLQRVVLVRQNSDVSQEAVERIARQSAGMTIADLERIVHEAAVTAARNDSRLDDAVLEEAFEKFRLGAARQAPDRQTLERTARHEAGHSLIAWMGGNPPLQVTIVGRAHAAGRMEPERDETRGSYTKSEILQLICECMGGRAAEILFYGEEEGLDTGAAGDLQHATRLAVGMVRNWGMTADFGQIAIEADRGGKRRFDGPLAAKIIEAAERIVKEQLLRAIDVLNRHRPYLEKISTELMEKNRLTREDLASILPPVQQPER